MRQSCTPLLVDIEKFLKKRRKKLRGGHMGYSRGQKEIIGGMLTKIKKLKKKYK